jgi:Uma2 family endonuclease
MAGPEAKTRSYTYEDLAGFPDDNKRREIIDGELIVTAAPIPPHQDVVMRLAGELYQYAKSHGGKVYPATLDVYFSETDVVEPDVLFLSREHLQQIESKYVRSAPDVVVEVSSPSTRRLELHRKRALYERFGVPEYWYVDLESDRVEVYRFAEERYGTPSLLTREDVLESSRIPGFSIGVDELLGAAED